MKLVKTSTYNH